MTTAEAPALAGIARNLERPTNAMSGFFVGVYRDAAQTDASYIPFIVPRRSRFRTRLHKRPTPPGHRLWPLRHAASPLAAHVLSPRHLDVADPAHAVFVHGDMTTRDISEHPGLRRP